MIYNIEFFDPSTKEKQLEYLSKLSDLDRILISRYAYRIGLEPLLYDSEYDRMLEQSQFSYLKEVLYEKDDVQQIKDHLIYLGIYLHPVEVHNRVEKEKLMNMFQENKSMMCVTNVKDLKEKYFNVYLNESTDYFQLTYKHDGWNISIYYLPNQEEIVFAHTRGRDSAEYRDCTDIMKMKVPKMKVTVPTKIVGEVQIRKDYMERLKKKYPDKKWSTPRSSVSTFMSGGIDEEDFDAITFFAFKYDDLSGNEYSPKQQYEILTQNKFNVPMNKIIPVNPKAIVEALNQFEDYYVNTLEDMYDCDGLVMMAHTKGIYKEVFSAYSTGMVAIKASYWASEILKSTILEIFYSENKSEFTPKAKIAPVESKNGSIIRVVPLLNPRLVREHWLCPGDEILIEYHSQQNVYFKGKVSGAKNPNI